MAKGIRCRNRVRPQLVDHSQFLLNKLKKTHVSIAHFVDLDEMNKKVIECDLPGSLLCDIRGTIRSRLA
jgi:hypothetical protein